MQYDFSFQNPTRIHFGRSALEKLPKELSAFGPRVLLVYGGGSIKQSGLYETIKALLCAAGKEVQELSGVPSNPTADFVYRGASLARAQDSQLILAVGGGSVLDCAKAIAAAACYEGDFWTHFCVEGASPTQAIPLGSVLTMAGTGSEMNGGAVITHTPTRVKTGMSGALLYPVFSILNPELTFTVPRAQMVSGICDIMSHILEIYMSPSDDDNLSDALCEAILRNLIRSAYRALENPQDYEARANIMWGASLALNGLLEGSKQQDWMVHQIEHQIGAYTNCPHGLGLAAVSGAYYRAILPHAPARFVRFAQNVWELSAEGRSDVELGLAGIAAMEAFFKTLGAPTSLRDLGLDASQPLDEIADSCRILRGGYLRLTRTALRELFQAAF